MRALFPLPLFILSTFIFAGSFSGGLSFYQEVKAHHWGWFLISMFASYGLADAIFLWSTRSLGVPAALAIASCFPVWTVIGGYFFGGETISLKQGFGLFLTVSGVISVILSGTHTKQTVTQSEMQKVTNPPQAPASKGQKLGFFCAFLTSILWAINGFAISRGAAELMPVVGNTIRMIIALILTSVLAKIFAPKTAFILPLNEVKKYWHVFIIEGFLGACLSVYGLSRSPLALGATLSSLSPVISVPMSVALGLESFSVPKTFAVGVVVIGIGFLTGAF